MWGIGEAFCQWLIHNKHLVFFVHQHLCIGIYCCLRETSTTLTTPKTSRIIVNEHQAKSQNLKLKFRQKPNATSPPVHHLQPVLEIGVPSSSRSTLNKRNFLINLWFFCSIWRELEMVIRLQTLLQTFSKVIHFSFDPPEKEISRTCNPSRWARLCFWFPWSWCRSSKCGTKNRCMNCVSPNKASRMTLTGIWRSFCQEAGSDFRPVKYSKCSDIRS